MHCDCFGYIKVYCQSHKLGIAEHFHLAAASCLYGGLTDFKGTLPKEEIGSIFWLGEKNTRTFSPFRSIWHFFVLLDELKVLHDFLCPSKCWVFMWSMFQMNINRSYNFISFPSNWNLKKVIETIDWLFASL